MQTELPLDLSIVVPIRDEGETLEALHDALTAVLAPMDRRYEIIFVDDGSIDESMSILESLHQRDPRVKVIHFRTAFGKAAALDAGFKHVTGSIVITMDGDLQDDPKEIPRFLDSIESGFDLVNGWKKKRHDPLKKTVPSRLFNCVTRLVTDLPLHDINCGFKAYRHDLVTSIDLYGELHRFIPVMANRMGFKVGEIVVEHYPRRTGNSKFGCERFVRGFFDLLTITMITKYNKRPLHLFGLLGLLFLLTGGCVLFYLTILWFSGVRPIGNRPLFLFGVLFVLFGMQLFSIGLMSEMFTKIGHKHDKGYCIGRKLF